MSAPTGSAPAAGDPWGARLAFYVVGDTKACTRFLVAFVVVLAAIAALATMSPGAAAALGSVATAGVGLAGGHRAVAWWRSRPSDPAITDRDGPGADGGRGEPDLDR